MDKANNSLNTLSDQELARLVRIGKDEAAFNELAVRYLGKIGFIARKYSAQGYEQKDFVQEGLLGLLYAAKTFDESGGASFKSYLSLVVERRYISIIRRQSALRAVPDSVLLQLDNLDFEPIDTSPSPEELVMLREQLEAVRERLSVILSKRELEVLMLYAEGMSYGKIAKKLGITEKSVDNALQRARRKVERDY